MMLLTQLPAQHQLLYTGWQPSPWTVLMKSSEKSFVFCFSFYFASYLHNCFPATNPSEEFNQLYDTGCFAAFLTIGAYADWLGVAPNAPVLLPPLLNLLTMGLAIPEDPAAAAALAFKHVCDGNKNSILVLHNPYQCLIKKMYALFWVLCDDSL